MLVVHLLVVELLAVQPAHHIQRWVCAHVRHRQRAVRIQLRHQPMQVRERSDAQAHGHLIPPRCPHQLRVSVD